MIINSQLVYRNEYRWDLKKVNSVLIPYLFNNNESLIITIQSKNSLLRSYENAGRMDQVLIDYQNKLVGSSQVIGLTKNYRVNFPKLGRFQLEFFPSGYLQKTLISISIILDSGFILTPTPEPTPTPVPGSGYSSTVIAPIGSEGMTQIISSHTDDGSISIGDIGFDFPFYGIVYRNNIYLGSNSFITFGFSSDNFENFSVTFPGKGLFILAADRSYQKVFVKQDFPGKSFRIRYEGRGNPELNEGNSNQFWECILFVDGTICLITGNLNLSNGFSAITNGSDKYTNYTINDNSSIVFIPSQAGYSVQVGSYRLE